MLASAARVSSLPHTVSTLAATRTVAALPGAQRRPRRPSAHVRWSRRTRPRHIAQAASHWLLSVRAMTARRPVRARSTVTARQPRRQTKRKHEREKAAGPRAVCPMASSVGLDDLGPSSMVPASPRSPRRPRSRSRPGSNGSRPGRRALRSARPGELLHVAGRRVVQVDPNQGQPRPERSKLTTPVYWVPSTLLHFDVLVRPLREDLGGEGARVGAATVPHDNELGAS
jgi:hypothetical protein